MINQIKTPQVGVYAQKSKWNAVNQSINFEVQRKDSIANSMYKTNGIVKVKLLTSLPFEVAVGQVVFVSFPSYSVTCNIIAINGAVISVDAPFLFSSAIYGGFVNWISAFKNYHFVSDVYGFVNGQNHTLIGSIETKLNSFGVGKVAVQDWLKTRARNINEFKYNKKNERMVHEGTSFYLNHKEYYTGLLKTYTDGSKNLFYWINSAKQIGEKFGRNVAEHVLTIDATRTEKAKFQSVFKKLTYFVGYPFSLNFIYSDNLTNVSIRRVEQYFDVNGVEVNAPIIASLSMANRFHANRLMIKQNYSLNIDNLLVWIESTDTPVGGVYSAGHTTGYTVLFPSK